MAKKKEPVASLFVPVEEQPYKIPDNWCWTYGGTVLEAMESQKPIGEEFDYIDIDAIDNQKQTVNSPKRLPVSKAPSRASRKLHAGDTVFSLVRPYLKNIAYIDDSLAHCIASTGFFVCTPKSFLNSRYLYQLMISPYMVDGLNQYMKGDNSPSIRKDDIEQFPFPLPTLPEQQRIVARIESLFSKLDEAKEKAQAVVDGFELRKSAILHKAFTGKLTERWRKEHGVGIDSWHWDQLQNLCAKITDGTHHSPVNTPSGEYMYITAKNIKENGLDLSNITFVEEKIHNEIYSRCDVQYGDVLYIKDGATTGIAAFNSIKVPFSMLSSVAVIRPKRDILHPQYLVSVLNSAQIKAKMINNMSGNAITRLTLAKIKSSTIPICSIDEQQEIVRLLSNFIEKEQQAKEAAEAVLDQIDTMKKAILARAFRGELGTNDPAEEWAGDLLKTAL